MRRLKFCLLIVSFCFLGFSLARAEFVLNTDYSEDFFNGEVSLAEGARQILVKKNSFCADLVVQEPQDTPEIVVVEGRVSADDFGAVDGVFTNYLVVYHKRRELTVDYRYKTYSSYAFEANEKVYGAKASDFNGDGLKDFLVQVAADDRFWRVISPSDESYTSFVDQESFLSPALSSLVDQFVLFDINQDNFDDLITAQNTEAGCELAAFLNQETTSDFGRKLIPASTYLFADQNCEALRPAIIKNTPLVYIDKGTGEASEVLLLSDAGLFSTTTLYGAFKEDINITFSTWVDFDLDNDLDFFVSTPTQNILYQNEGDDFVRQTDGYSFLSDDLNQTQVIAASWFDYQADGDLDLVLVNLADDGFGGVTQNVHLYLLDQGVYQHRQLNLTQFGDETITEIISEPKIHNICPLDIDLDGDKDLVLIRDGQVNNLLYSDVDPDGDGIDGGYAFFSNPTLDNCPYAANPDQENIDGDAFGDVCDLDKDNDGIINEEDNCELIANPTQEDADVDGIGDACDEIDTGGRDLFDPNDEFTGTPDSVDPELNPDAAEDLEEGFRLVGDSIAGCQIGSRQAVSFSFLAFIFLVSGCFVVARLRLKLKKIRQ